MKKINRDFTNADPLELGRILLSDLNEENFYLADEKEYSMAKYEDTIVCEALDSIIHSSEVKYFRGSQKSLTRKICSELNLVILSLKNSE